MKRVMMIIVLACLLVAGCEGYKVRPVVWLQGAPGNDSTLEKNEFTGRIGIERLPVEIGVQSSYLAQACQWYGAYAVYHFIDEGSPETWLGRPYIGYQWSMPWDAEDGSMYGPIVGTVYWDVFTIEPQYRDFAGKLNRELRGEEALRIALGFRYRF